MQLTRAADYAVRIMIHMAQLPHGTRERTAALAKAGGIPREFLSKVLQRLVKVGLLRSHRGSSGGFQLAHPAAEVSLLDVIEAIEGPTHLNQCLISENACDRHATCPAHPVWIEAQEQLVKVLSGVSLAEMATTIRTSDSPKPACWERRGKFILLAITPPETAR
jgi:Rrf2 family protein